MTAVLHLGAPPVRYSPLGRCWLIEDGSLTPPRASTWRKAFEIAATYVPPAGDPLTHPGERIATTGGAGSGRSRPWCATETEGGHVLVPACSPSTAPGSVVPPPGISTAGPGASQTSLVVEGGGGVVLAAAGIPTGASAADIQNGAAA
jgi:hypothetical protein